MSGQDPFFYIPIENLLLRAKWIIPKNGEVGKKTALVFLHEGLGCIEQWRDFPDKLVNATGYPGLLYDRNGYGGSSPCEDAWPIDYLFPEAEVFLPEVLQECGIASAILIGHSDGGTIALLTAALMPGLVKGAVVEAAHIFVEDITVTGIRQTVEKYKTGNLREALKKYHPKNVDCVFFRWADRWLSTEFKNWNISDMLSGITCPLLVIQGTEDRYGTQAQVEGIVRQVSGPAFAKMIPGCGHTPHFQAEKEVLEEMSRFIFGLI
jgi:pimeloyl-ACP methyl ester carboxylesterase